MQTLASSIWLLDGFSGLKNHPKMAHDRVMADMTLRNSRQLPPTADKMMGFIKPKSVVPMPDPHTAIPVASALLSVKY